MSERLWARRPWMVCLVCLSVSGATLHKLRVINSYLLRKELWCLCSFSSLGAGKTGNLQSLPGEKSRPLRHCLCPIAEDGFTPRSPPRLFSRSVTVIISIWRCGRKRSSHPSPGFNPAVIVVRTHKIDLSGLHIGGPLALLTARQVHKHTEDSGHHQTTDTRNTL